MNRLKVFLLLVCIVGLSPYHTYAQTYVFAQLNGSPNLNTTGWNLTGNAFAGDTPGDVDNFSNELVLTNNTNWQSGGVFWGSPINPLLCTKWTVEFEYRMFDGNGADGLAFCFLDVPPSGFVNGGGMGIPGAANGLKVCLDTYNNCGGPNPELQIYSGPGYDECIAGMVKLDNTAGNLGFIRNNGYQAVEITYNNGLIELYINNTLYLSANFTIGFSGYMGFTASTGGLYDSHSIRNVVIYTDQAVSDAGFNAAICSGGSTTLGTAPNAQYVYSWSPPTGLSATNVANPTVSLVNNTSNIQNQVYTVTTSLASNPGICPTTDQVVVSVYPNYNTFLTDTVCDGGPYPFNGQSISSSGQYIANLQSITGCDSIVQLDLVISNNPVVIVNDTSFCAGGTAVISPTGAPNFTWNPAPGVVSASGTLSFTPTQTTTLTVTGSNEFLCESSEMVTVTVFPLPDVTLISDVSDVCPGEAAQLLANGANTYLWFGNDINGANGNMQNVFPQETEAYQVVGSSAEGCADAAEWTISYHEAPVLSITSDTAICQGETLNLSASGADDYQWIGGPLDDNWSISPPSTNAYEVVGTNAFGCTDTASCIVVVYPLPIAEIGAYPTTVFSDSPQVDFENNSTGFTSSVWDFDNGQTFETNDPSFTHTFPVNDGNYLVNLTVTNSFGCTDVDIMPIQVVSDVIYFVPNAFTPDGNEFNNMFLPIFTSGFDTYSYECSVYNRWGELLFQSNDHTVGWDGTYLGKMCPDGVYTWVISYKLLTNDEKNVVKGHVQLMR